ncbi:hypothetical protein [Candidatus Thiodiazotropha sp. CDECU1]|uniref:hypothetical protein n=1 Tax=Candidatus Thiodiazotropha sp. CDECU1 TaxID=3065865 RepID=UPI00292E9460|nr:hypothetical protein [Candidatus Thiodiazotropha sp. CDECU1]
MNGLRKAALYLHGLEETDRRWLLNALSDAERERLQTTLAELDEMGVPSGNAWLPELAEAQIMEVPEEESNPLSSEIETIKKAGLSRLMQIIEHEPVKIVAQLLRHRVWPWHQDYIDKQDPLKRKQLLRALESSTSPLLPKVETALLSALAARLDQTESVSGGGFEAALVVAQRDQESATQEPGWRRLWRR